ncbi:Anhydro-N-acetylmuramic acid kinase [Sulfurovum sp. enrichment culture clone C5]|uniref:Anhydro-N-acetylmuramic acid kinase n=1 Tax=Sulfurovum sp. enrichment culture clone C5 TaxID=497650 RepID=A0A0S4XNK7_9BACT|nr:Anhydro-N-acetylmuramic acid kinase [Sulfurovum sp. enrichment culture clone C5]
MSEFYIGVMSGTSLDGVDIALCVFDEHKKVKLQHFDSFPFDIALKTDILKAINGCVALKEIGDIDDKLGQMYAKYIKDFIKTYSLNPQDIKAVGLHGQTVWHEPKSGFSMQLGNPNRVAYETGIAVVCDIRRMDMASGGQGAPFAPLFHKLMFDTPKTAVVNIGGMANITILGDKLLGFDTGCGNVLIDSWCQKYFDIPYDEDGKMAKSGEIDKVLLEVMLNDEYFKQDYPKSTGREYFNLAWVEEKLLRHSELVSESKTEMLKRVQHDKQLRLDILRTLTELTAMTIVNEAKKFDIESIILCGGGTKNSLLVERIGILFGKNVKLTSDYGVREDAIEAIMMSYFAYLRIRKQKAELKDVTGAKENLILGGLYEPN